MKDLSILNEERKDKRKSYKHVAKRFLKFLDTDCHHNT